MATRKKRTKPERLQPTAVDYLVVGLVPALIIGMICGLVFFLILAFFMLLGFCIALEVVLLAIHESQAPGSLFGQEASLSEIARYVIFVTGHEMTAGFFEIFPHFMALENDLFLNSQANFLMGLTMVFLKFTVASILATEIGGELISTLRHLPGSFRFAVRRYHDELNGKT